MAEILYLLPRLSWWLADGTFVLHESIDCPRIHPTLLDIYTAPVMAALFPELHARSLRTIAAGQLANGEIPSTLGVSSVQQHEYRLFNSGDASVFPIVTAWEILWGGDPEFAREMYPVLKKVLRWGERELDADRDGVVDVHGIDQGWDTFPMYGAAAYIADQWIAALLAGETLARRSGDAEFAAWCAAIRRKASATAENLLWNGNYYDLAHDPAGGTKSNICFADQFTYSDCLILWDVMYALLGVQVDLPARSLRLAPPRIPVKVPLLAKLYCGQVDFSGGKGQVNLRLTNFANTPSLLRSLTIRLPPGATTWWSGWPDSRGLAARWAPGGCRTWAGPSGGRPPRRRRRWWPLCRKSPHPTSSATCPIKRES